MRTIKFRAFVNGEMLEQAINTPYGASRLLGFLDANGVHDFDKVMQFTGLFDKNGKEIYEGDILDEKWKWVISYKNDGFMFSPNLHWDISSLYKLIKHREKAGVPIEIIGNIYENPELLEP